MKLLLVGNHTCGNRGDAAILRGLIAELKAQVPGIEIEAISRYPVSSSFLLGQPLTPDTLYAYHDENNSIFDRLWKLFSRRALPQYLHQAISGGLTLKLPSHIREQIDILQSYDAVIQVGGSFFVDLYGVAQFEHALCAIIAKKPLFLLGHSVGPFGDKSFSRVANLVFDRVHRLSLRESVSLELMEQANLPTHHVYQGADTAWLVPAAEQVLSKRLAALIAEKPTVAFTLRELAPFDKRLGISQSDYEQAFARLADELIDQGYQVLVFSTCTGIGGYNKDDRMVGLAVANRVKRKENFHVVMDELNDLELGACLGQCALTIGTRLHSAIISMNFDTPAIALNYEHKSEGLMAQLGLPQYAKNIDSLFDGSLLFLAKNLLDNIEEEKVLIFDRVEGERKRARQMVADTIADLNSIL